VARSYNCQWLLTSFTALRMSLEYSTCTWHGIQLCQRPSNEESQHFQQPTSDSTHLYPTTDASHRAPSISSDLRRWLRSASQGLHRALTALVAAGILQIKDMFHPQPFPGPGPGPWSASDRMLIAARHHDHSSRGAVLAVPFHRN
jgi:hypothetical protein